MLFHFLSKLFNTKDYYGEYVAHPVHTLYALLIMAAGWATMLRDGWMLFGIIMIVLGLILFATIVMSINWDKTTKYWSTLDEFAKTMMKANNPDLWSAMGFKNVPQNVTITEIVPESKEEGWHSITHRIPVSPATMQMIADKVLMSNDTDFTQDRFHHVPNFRKVQKHFKKDGLIAQKNNRNPRLGYSFNRKGIDALWEYASEGVKLELRKKEIK